MSWTDTHAHVYVKEFDADRAEVLRRASDTGVAKIYMPNIDHTSIDAMLEAELRYYGQCIPMMGLHPCSVGKDFERELYVMESWLARREFCAIGEMGTDLYWDKSWWEQQKEAFRIQAAWAVKYDLPLVIHCRESMNETIDLLESLDSQKPTGIFHCFTGSSEQAKRVVNLGFYLGIGGVSTFKNGGLDKVLPDVSLDRIVLETDSPYLAPVPFRGKRNEPSYIPLVAERVAGIKQLKVQDLMSATEDNVRKIFTKEKDGRSIASASPSNQSRQI